MNDSDYRFWDIVIKTAQALALTAGGGFALYKYRKSVQVESRKPFWEKQLSLYFAAAEAAAIIATSKDKEKRQQAEEDFWMLYYGSLAIVEDAGAQNLEKNSFPNWLGRGKANKKQKDYPKNNLVEKAMIEFGECLNVDNRCNQTEL